MTPQNPRLHFSNPSIALHWLMAVLLVATAATMESKGIYPKGSPERDALKAVHYMLGASVFVLVWLRLLARAVWADGGVAGAGPADAERQRQACAVAVGPADALAAAHA